MKNKKWLYLIIAGAIIVCAIVLIFPMQKDKKVIREFLNVSLTKSEENIKLYELLMESKVIIGEGVDENTQLDSLKKAEIAEKEFTKVYGKYMSAHGLENFQEKMFSYISSLHSGCKECEIINTKIEKDNDYYKFQVTLAVDGIEQKLEGRAEVTDGKINKVVLTTF